MITEKTLDEAMVEAARFLKTAKAYRVSRRLGEDSQACQVRLRTTGHWSTIAEHAACTRASLDLTRKLADLRAGR